MNKLQLVEYDLLKTFISICEQLNIKYFMVCGSALGTVKYKGFIPWDDDIDVGLYREDYELFCRYAQDILPDYYFLQNYKTDPNFPAIYSKLRDSRTTYIENSVENLDINHGVYIDIFPLDGYPKENKQIKKLEFLKKIYSLLLGCNFSVNDKYSFKSKCLFTFLRILGIHKMSRYIVKRYELMISKWRVEDSDLICNHGNWQGKLEYAPKWHYGEGKTVSFEGIEVRIPENYDDYLHQKYGDWQLDLPDDQKVGHHYYRVLDLDKSFKEYTSLNKND